jgi:hypothetical protein
MKNLSQMNVDTQKKKWLLNAQPPHPLRRYVPKFFRLPDAQLDALSNHMKYKSDLMSW